jgi:hypothetical protein
MKYLYKKRPLNIIFKRLNKLTSLYILLKVVASDVSTPECVMLVLSPESRGAQLLLP